MQWTPTCPSVELAMNYDYLLRLVDIEPADPDDGDDLHIVPNVEPASSHLIGSSHHQRKHRFAPGIILPAIP
jgi:hypothetical protein